MIELHIISNNENKTVCAECGGKCCKSYPGAYTPDQFSSKEEIVRLIKDKKAQIDWWESSDPTYFLRAATDDFHYGIFSPIYGGSCVNLTEKGCSLSFENRPMQCQTLIVNVKLPGECSLSDPKKYDKYGVSISWTNSYFNLKEIGEECDD